MHNLTLAKKFTLYALDEVLDGQIEKNHSTVHSQWGKNTPYVDVSEVKRKLRSCEVGTAEQILRTKKHEKSLVLRVCAGLQSSAYNVETDLSRSFVFIRAIK